jgi:acetate kinase
VFRDGESPELLVRGQVEGLLTKPTFTAHDAGRNAVGPQGPASLEKPGHQGAIEFLFAWVRQEGRKHRIVAAGHRVVHGGVRFAGPVRIDADVLLALQALAPLAPLHQPHNVSAIQAVAEQAPKMPQVACFDTAFHRAQPAVAQAFALPRRYAGEGVHRYGFHGLSYEYIASVLRSACVAKST